MKTKLIFKWFDLWVGFFWDSKKKWLYFLPLPMVGIIFKFADFDLPKGYSIEKIEGAYNNNGKDTYVGYHNKGVSGEMQLDNCSTYLGAYNGIMRSVNIREHYPDHAK